MQKPKQPIATKTLTNVSGLAIYEYTSDEVLIGFNNEEPKWVEIEYDVDGEPYVNFYGQQYLNEFIKTNLGA